jgi:SAM-dependent methyltransferase
MRQQEEQQRSTRDAAMEVRDFYERYPYPGPVDRLDHYQLRWDDPQKRRADFHLFWPANPYREDFSILVAGCGTSQAAKHAMRWPKAEVTGIDFSATSVHCTEELKRKYNLSNLQLHQLPVERAGELETHFDQIVCTGVLHHLPDPDTGLTALRSVLKPDGAMHLMLYAPYGRTGIYMLQEFCRQLDIHADDEGIRDLIAALRLLPPGHPLGTLLREAPDFRREASLADALLHPQDRAYSVPQFFDFLEKGGMTFVRWVKQAPYAPQCGVMAQIPRVSRISGLPLVEQYAAAELFRGTMVRHSAIAYRDDRPAHTNPLRFSGDDWHACVPVRMPDTIAVKERLPHGASAVLINRTHSFRDLFLPIDSTEILLFEAIDGVSSIGEIVCGSLPSLPDSEHHKAHTFFKQLFLYDQIVFDTSRQSGVNSAPPLERAYYSQH